MAGLAQAGAEAIRSSGSRELKIFIVDDEYSSLSALGYRLAKENKMHGYKVFCFDSGEDCVKHMFLEPDLILMDQYLACDGDEHLCGTNLIRKIRKINPEVPVVIIPGKKKPGQIMESDEDESFYYLVKDETAFESVRKIIGLLRPAIVH